MGKQFSVTVVVPAYNCENTIAETIQGILTQTYLPESIIIVDDGSTDQTARKIKSFEKITYVYQENAGPAAARNRGAKAATTDLIFFTDSDCVPQKDWIEKAEKHFSDATIAVVMGSYGIVNKNSILARCIHREIVFRHQHLMPNYPKAFGSYNVAIRRHTFELVGGFDQTYRRASGEDNELSYRILQKGYRIFFAKEALVDHYFPTGVMHYLKEQYRHGYWRVKMYKRYPAMTVGDDYTFWKDIVEIPLVAVVLFCFFLSWALPVLWRLFLISSTFVWGINLCFSFLATKSFSETIFSSVVMTLRAFARMFGFAAGMVDFYILKKH